MRPFFWLCGTALIAAISAVGQSTRGPLEGVWQAIEVMHTVDHPMTIKPGQNLSIFSAKHFSRIDIQSGKLGRRSRMRLALLLINCVRFGVR